MRVEVHVSGGVTGARLGGALDTDTLDRELAQRVEAALAPCRLQAAAARESRPMPDQREWTVTVEGQRYEVSEAALEDDQVAALDGLVAEVGRRKRGGGG